MSGVLRMLPILAIFAFFTLQISSIKYTVHKETDDLIRILKEICNSSRGLMQTARANNIRAPFNLTNGTVIEIICPPPPTRLTSTAIPVVELNETTTVANETGAIFNSTEIIETTNVSTTEVGQFFNATEINETTKATTAATN